MSKVIAEYAIMIRQTEDGVELFRLIRDDKINKLATDHLAGKITDDEQQEGTKEYVKDTENMGLPMMMMCEQMLLQMAGREESASASIPSLIQPMTGNKHSVEKIINELQKEYNAIKNGRGGSFMARFSNKDKDADNNFFGD